MGGLNAKAMMTRDLTVNENHDQSPVETEGGDAPSAVEIRKKYLLRLIGSLNGGSSSDKPIIVTYVSCHGNWSVPILRCRSSPTGPDGGLGWTKWVRMAVFQHDVTTPRNFSHSLLIISKPKGILISLKTPDRPFFLWRFMFVYSSNDFTKRFKKVPELPVNCLYCRVRLRNTFWYLFYRLFGRWNNPFSRFTSREWVLLKYSKALRIILKAYYGP